MKEYHSCGVVCFFWCSFKERDYTSVIIIFLCTNKLIIQNQTLEDGMLPYFLSFSSFSLFLFFPEAFLNPRTPQIQQVLEAEDQKQQQKQPLCEPIASKPWDFLLEFFCRVTFPCKKSPLGGYF